MKYYVDMTFTKLNGQNVVHSALHKLVHEFGVYANPKDADVLIYCQFNEQTYNDAKRYRKEGKTIVMCHHYTAASVFHNCYAVNCLDVIDYHFVQGKDSELYSYLLRQGVEPSQIIIEDFSVVDRFYRDDEKEYDIIFVGRKSKGFDHFERFVKINKLDKCIALCPDAPADASVTVLRDVRGTDVLDYMAKSKVIYSYSSYNCPKGHLETTMHEAITCGCVNLVDNMYDYILDVGGRIGYVEDAGFIKADDLELVIGNPAVQKNMANKARKWQAANYQQRREMLMDVLNVIRIKQNENE